MSREEVNRVQSDPLYTRTTGFIIDYHGIIIDGWDHRNDFYASPGAAVMIFWTTGTIATSTPTQATTTQTTMETTSPRNVQSYNRGKHLVGWPFARNLKMASLRIKKSV
jgi:hypothetical protein